MIGIDPKSIVPLSFVSADLSDSVPNKSERFRAVASTWIEDRYGSNRFSWEDHWHYASHELLAQAFTRDELIRLWHDCVLMSELDSHFQEHEALAWKVQHSLWRYGCTRNYKRFVAFYNGLGRIAVDLPNFAIRLTHTRYINTAAWAAHGRDNPIYLDASFGVLLYYKSKHVMTIGFAFSVCGILVAQVQLREKHGNRFLYKIPTPYLDFALDLLQRAFPNDKLYLVTGTSTVAGIKAAYGKNADNLPLETRMRIKRFYDQELSCYTRTRETVLGCGDDKRMFVCLMNRSESKKSTAKAA